MNTCIEVMLEPETGVKASSLVMGFKYPSDPNSKRQFELKKWLKYFVKVFKILRKTSFQKSHKIELGRFTEKV
jgi:hypothetical protein